CRDQPLKLPYLPLPDGQNTLVILCEGRFRDQWRAEPWQYRYSLFTAVARKGLTKAVTILLSTSAGDCGWTTSYCTPACLNPKILNMNCGSLPSTANSPRSTMRSY